MLYKKFKTDPKIEEKGVWIDYGDGVKVKIARAGGANAAFKKAVERHARKYRHQLRTGLMPADKADAVLREVFADTVILDWEGVTDEDGNVLEFTRENVVKVLEDLPDFFQDLQEQASNIELFKAEVLEKDLKN